MRAVIVGPDILIIVVVGALLVLPVWAAIDAAGKPAWAFERAGTNKALWIALPIIGIVFCGVVGIVAGILWFSSTRPNVVAATLGSSRPDQFASAPPSSIPPPPSVPTAPPADWYPDPARRHELRYFDGTTWTTHVSDKGSQSEDPV